MRPWKTVCGAIGIAIALSGCLKIEGTTTVLEDGQIIDRVALQPKMSMLASIAASYDALTHLSEQSAWKSYATKRESLAKFRAVLSTVTDGCEVADAIFRKKAHVRQGIPYSTVPVPIKFEYSGIRGNGCSIQVGPYDPRTLPVDFAEDVMAIRVEPLAGVHSPYKVSSVGISLPEIGDLSNLKASCTLEDKPDLCLEEMMIAISMLRNFDEESSGKLRSMLSNPGMLLGLAEMTRSLLKNLSVTLVMPDNAALGIVRGPGDFTPGRGWRWRGNILEAISASPAMSFEVRPRRAVAR